jgi:hypothetical protein
MAHPPCITEDAMSDKKDAFDQEMKRRSELTNERVVPFSLAVVDALLPDFGKNHLKTDPRHLSRRLLTSGSVQYQNKSSSGKIVLTFNLRDAGYLKETLSCGCLSFDGRRPDAPGAGKRRCAMNTVPRFSYFGTDYAAWERTIAAFVQNDRPVVQCVSEPTPLLTLKPDRDLIAVGELATVGLGRLRRIPYDSIVAYLNRHRNDEAA